MPSVRYALADDQPLHRSMAKMAMSGLTRTPMALQFEVVKEAEHGKDLVDWLAACPPDRLPQLITLDIRMPVMDGLTALLHIRRRLKLTLPVCMCSSEDQATIDRHLAETAPPQVKAMSAAEKMANLAKVEARILAGQSEPGKINDLLTGCERLCMDPKIYARQLGANGFLHKPYTPEMVKAIIPEVLNGKSFAS
jgi:CheY-like chemotaxis protein